MLLNNMLTPREEKEDDKLPDNDMQRHLIVAKNMHKSPLRSHSRSRSAARQPIQSLDREEGKKKVSQSFVREGKGGKDGSKKYYQFYLENAQKAIDMMIVQHHNETHVSKPVTRQSHTRGASIRATSHQKPRPIPKLEQVRSAHELSNIQLPSG
jgi:hypothetical protein